MAVAWRMTLTGDKQLAAALRALPDRLQRGALRTAARRAGGVVRAEMRRRAPVDTGFLRRQIKTRSIQRNRRGIVGVTVGASARDYTGQAFYASFIEYGTSRMPARPFLRPAFTAARGRAEAIFAEELRAQLRTIKQAS